MKSSKKAQKRLKKQVQAALVATTHSNRTLRIIESSNISQGTRDVNNQNDGDTKMKGKLEPERLKAYKGEKTYPSGVEKKIDRRHINSSPCEFGSDQNGGQEKENSKKDKVKDTNLRGRDTKAAGCIYSSSSESESEDIEELFLSCKQEKSCWGRSNESVKGNK